MRLGLLWKPTHLSDPDCLAPPGVLTQLGGYYMQCYHMQQSIFNPYNVGGTAADGNIPYSQVKGIEASMQSHVGRQLLPVARTWSAVCIPGLDCRSVDHDDLWNRSRKQAISNEHRSDR